MSKADKFYVIEEMLKQRTRKGNVEYFVKWKGYSSKSNSWVPSSWVIDLPKKQQKPKKPTTEGVRQSTTGRISKANNHPTTTRKSTESALISSTAKTNTLTSDARSRNSSGAGTRISKANDRRTAGKTNSPAGDSRRTTKTRIIVPASIVSTAKKGARKSTTGRISKANNHPTTLSTNKLEKLYQIEQILARRIVNSKVEYLVHWKGYSRAESTWEPEGPLKSDYCQMYCHSLRQAFLD